MNSEDKEIVLNLVSRLPANATLFDLAREVESLALAHPQVAPHLGGVSPKKVIVVPGRMVNIVI